MPYLQIDCRSWPSIWIHKYEICFVTYIRCRNILCRLWTIILSWSHWDYRSPTPTWLLLGNLILNCDISFKHKKYVIIIFILRPSQIDNKLCWFSRLGRTLIDSMTLSSATQYAMFLIRAKSEECLEFLPLFYLYLLL